MIMNSARCEISKSGLLQGSIKSMNHEERILFYEDKKAQNLQQIKNELNKEILRNNMHPEINNKKKFVPLDHKYLEQVKKEKQENLIKTNEEQRLKSNNDIIQFVEDQRKMEEDEAAERERMLQMTRTPDFPVEIVWSE